MSHDAPNYEALLKTIDIAGGGGLGLMHKRAHGSITGLPTWSQTWNRACLGYGGGKGIPSGWLVIIGGATGMGKTTVACSLVDGWLKTGAQCAYVTLESEPESVAHTLYRMNGAAVRVGSGGSLDARREQWRRFGWTGQLQINGRFVRDLVSIEGAIRQWAAKGTSHVVIDYVQLFGSGDIRSRSAAVAEATAVFYDLTRDTGCTILLMSQLGREGMKLGRPPEVWDLQLSSGLEHRADQIVLLDFSRYERNQATGLAKSWLLIKKTRDGIDGLEIPYEIDWPQARFREGLQDEVDKWPDNGRSRKGR